MKARTPSEVFRERLRTVRERKGWKQHQLAERMTEMGAPMHQTAVAKLENGERKQVTLDDTLALAAALDVSPLSLILPLDDHEPVALTPASASLSGSNIRAWVGGFNPLTCMLYGSGEYRTLDGRVLTEAEAKARQRFYEAEVSNEEWRARQIPGLGHLRDFVEVYKTARISGADSERLRTWLDHLKAEVERQLASLTEEQGD